ncbi:MAG: HEAT repeat domain-containing protein [Chthoniobacter sp.]
MDYTPSRSKEGVSSDAWAEGAAAVIGRKELKEVRPLAVAVYAQLQQKAGAPLLRGLLKDDDPEVRAIAAAELARFKDDDSIDSIVASLEGKNDARWACSVIEAIDAWGEPRLAPALIAYLETGGLFGYSGDDFQVPALKAREALEKMTGATFPSDVESSRQAWKEAAQIEDAAERKTLLAKLLRMAPNPLKAEVIGDGDRQCLCKITNQSPRDITIGREPDLNFQDTPAGSGSSEGRAKKTRRKTSLS